MASERGRTLTREGAAARRRAGNLRRALACAWIAAFALLLASLAGCGGAGTSRRAAPTPEKSDFEKKLDIVRRAPHVKIYVVRRKDSAPLDADDKDYLRHNTPLEVATWVLTDDGTTAIAGANFDFEPKHFEALSKRFTVEDYTGK